MPTPEDLKAEMKRRLQEQTWAGLQQDQFLEILADVVMTVVSEKLAAALEPPPKSRWGDVKCVPLATASTDKPGT